MYINFILKDFTFGKTVILRAAEKNVETTFMYFITTK